MGNTAMRRQRRRWDTLPVIRRVPAAAIPVFSRISVRYLCANRVVVSRLMIDVCRVYEGERRECVGNSVDRRHAKLGGLIFEGIAICNRGCVASNYLRRQ